MFYDARYCALAHVVCNIFDYPFLNLQISRLLMAHCNIDYVVYKSLRRP